MQITERYHNHIGFYQNIFPQGFCSHLITEFDTLCSYGRVCNRQDDEKASKINKEDQYTFIDYTNHRSQIGDLMIHIVLILLVMPSKIALIYIPQNILSYRM